MKVVKAGREQRGWSHEFECTGEGNGGGGCGAVLLVEQDDLYLTSQSSRDETEHYVTFKCVSCEVETDLASGGPRPPRSLDIPSKDAWERSHPRCVDA